MARDPFIVCVTRIDLIYRFALAGPCECETINEVIPVIPATPSGRNESR